MTFDPEPSTPIGDLKVMLSKIEWPGNDIPREVESRCKAVAACHDQLVEALEFASEQPGPEGGKLGESRIIRSALDAAWKVKKMR